MVSVMFFGHRSVLKKSRWLVKPILQPQIADSSSRNAVSFSSAYTTKRFSVVAVIPLPKCRMIRENSRRRSKSLDAIRRVSLESGERSSLSRRRRKSHECGLAAMEFRLKVDYENIKLRFT